MLKTIYSARWYLVLGLLTFLLTLVVTVPLHFVWRFVEPQLQGLPVQISQVRGSVWQGSARVRVPQLLELGEIDGRWQLQPAALLLGELKLQLKFDTPDLRLRLPVTLSASHLKIDAGNGYFDLAPLKPIFAREQGSAEGAVELQQLVTTVQLEPLAIEDISGRLTYSGGQVSLLVENKPVKAELPPLLGQLSKDSDKAVLVASTQEQQTLFEGFLKDDGWAGLAIRRSFIDVLGQTWPMKAEADDVIFEVSRKVL